MTLDPGAGASQAPARQGRSHHPIGSFEPELGGALREVTLAYETWGELNEAADNAVLLTHALTGDSHAAGGPSEGYRRGGWWDPWSGRGVPIDTEKYFVVCSNVLGGCSGSTGPASVEPGDRAPLRDALPRDHHQGHGQGAEAAAGRARCQRARARHRGLHRRAAGARVGGRVPGFRARRPSP